ncbi:MAG TPA: hypothetical protein VFV34_03565 [Blastocatellia bacterium]|nr:hypothetical protein [Blastocatellia bacterium]
MFESQKGVATQKAAVAAYRTATMIVAALAFSIGLYLAISFMLTAGRRTTADVEGLRKIVYPAAVLLAIGSIVIRRTLLGWPRLERLGTTRGSAAVARHLLNVSLISAALGELTALLGLLLAILGGELIDFLRLGGVGLVVVALNYPRRRAWERTIGYFASKP